ncbi:MAG: tetratricopeptide repeat protein [Bacteroidota bacterium]
MARQKSKKKHSVQKVSLKQPAIAVKKKNIPLFIPLLGILLLTFLVYLKSLKNGFTNYDDDVLIINNSLVQSLSSENLYTIFFSFINGMYHPLVTLSWALEYVLLGSSAFHFHLINLIFHLLNIWLVYRFILLLTEKLNTAVIVALVFAVHPMVSESVLWLSERKDLLCTAFMLGGLIHYMKYLKNELRLKYIILTLIFLIFALLSKPSAVVFPLLLLVIDYYLGRKINKKVLIEKVPYFAFAISFGIIAIMAAGSVEGINTLKDYTFFDRIFFVAHAIMFYIYKLIIPVALSAKHFYPLKQGGFLPAEYYVSFAALVLIIITIIKYGKKNREIISGCFFYLACISIVLPVVPVGDTVVAERYSYLSYTGLLLIIGFLFDKYKNTIVLKIKTNRIFGFLMAAFIIFFSMVTYSRIEVWKNSDSLWTDVIKKDAYAVLAYIARGDAKAAEADYEAASKDYTMAIGVDSVSFVAYNNRGYVHIKTQQYDKAETDLNRAIQLQPAFTKAYYNRSCLYIEMKEYEKAIDDCNKTLLLSPEFTYAYYNRGNASYMQKKYNEAIADFDKAIAMEKDIGFFYYYRGLAHYELENYDSAVSDFSRVLNMNKDDADARLYRSKCYSKLKNYTEANTDLDELLYSDPGNPTYFYYKGNNKFMNSDFQGALEDYNYIISIMKDYAPAYYGRAKVFIATGVTDSVCINLTKSNELGLEVDEELLKEYCR